MLILAAAIAMLISCLNAAKDESGADTLLFVIPIGAVFFGFSIFRTIRKQTEIFQSFELTLDEFAISRTQINLPEAEIPTVKIDSIKRLHTGSLLVSGNGFQILVPKQLENFSEIEARLSAAKPIEEHSNSPFKKLLPLLPLVFIGLMLATFTVENLIVSLVLGVILILGLGYSAISILRNKNIDKRTKWRMWFIPMIMLVVIVNLYFRYTEGF